MLFSKAAAFVKEIAFWAFVLLIVLPCFLLVSFWDEVVWYKLHDMGFFKE
jgi:hypothetical protein